MNADHDRGVDVGESVWKPHAVRLAGQLVRHGVLTDGAWRDALLDVPRHHFIPHTHTPDPAAPGRWRRHFAPADPAAVAAWLARVYNSTALTVALSGIDGWGRQHPVAVSPNPELTVRMLQALDIHAGDRVLQLGAGSGHTTALLAHRVGDTHVTAVEIDPELRHLAATRLHRRDQHPHLVLADSTTLGACLHPNTKPEPAAGRGFDRVLACHSIDDVPAVWLHHTAPGALVLAVLSGGLDAGHPVLLRRTEPGTPTRTPTGTLTAPPCGAELTGYFLPWAAALPARRHRVRLATARAPGPAAERPRHCRTILDPATLHTDTPLALLHQLHLPPATTAAVRDNGTGQPATYLHARDGSWAEITHPAGRHGLRDARTAGPTNLLNALETAHTTFHDLHQPSWENFGITARPHDARARTVV